MMVHRTAQMDKMKKIVVFDVLLVFGVWYLGKVFFT